VDLDGLHTEIDGGTVSTLTPSFKSYNNVVFPACQDRTAKHKNLRTVHRSALKSENKLKEGVVKTQNGGCPLLVSPDHTGQKLRNDLPHSEASSAVCRYVASQKL